MQPSLQDKISYAMIILASPFNSYDSMENGIIWSALGDTLYGSQVAGTSYAYNDLTQLQIIAMQWWDINQNLPADAVKAEPADLTLQQVLDLTQGPNFYWNWSYSTWERVLNRKLK